MVPQRTNTSHMRHRSGLLTVREAAQWAGVSDWTVSGWIASGRLPARLVDRRRYIRLPDLAAAQAAVHLGEVLPMWRRNPHRAGLHLRALREQAGLTQLDLEAASGLSHEAISLLERGHRAPLADSVRKLARAPLADSVRKLARALGVAPEQFVGEEAVTPVGVCVTEAAAVLGVPATRVRDWLVAGKLAGTKISGQWRVPVTAVTALAGSERLRGRSRRLDPRYRG
jgi:excisionase family DNA binding protein